MISYKDMEHYDKFSDDESVYWVDVSGIPERFVNEAKKIDGDNYSGECFGMCIQHNGETGEFTPIEDSPGHNLYYVDNLGYKHWLDYRLSGQELEKIVSKICVFIEKMKTKEQSTVDNSAS